MKLAIPLIVLTGVLITASSMSYEQQDLRDYISMFPLGWVEHTFGFVNFTYSSGTVSVEEKGAAGFIEFFIRKGTHFFIYGALTLAVYISLLPYRLSAARKMLLAFLFITLFAVIDEVRHYYHPDRTGLWQDIVLDMAGGLAAILLISWVHHRKEKGS